MSHCQYMRHILKSMFPICIPEGSLRLGLPTLMMSILKPEIQWSTTSTGAVILRWDSHHHAQRDHASSCPVSQELSACAEQSHAWINSREHTPPWESTRKFQVKTVC